MLRASHIPGDAIFYWSIDAVLIKQRDIGVQVMKPSGVAKSIVPVVRVVHFLLWTSIVFQLTCAWTSK